MAVSTCSREASARPSGQDVSGRWTDLIFTVIGGYVRLGPAPAGGEEHLADEATGNEVARDVTVPRVCVTMPPGDPRLSVAGPW